MSELDYITLAEAEEISGIKADTLKKRCQEGKIIGAIKQGEVWRIPRSEIVKKPHSIQKDPFLLVMVEIANKHVGGMNYTFFVNGVQISGQLISVTEYFDIMKDIIRKSQNSTSNSYDLFEKIIDDCFLSYMPKKPSSVEELNQLLLSGFKFESNYIHLQKASVVHGGIKKELGEMPIRIALKDINAFYPGEEQS